MAAGASQDVTLNLVEGQYVMLCFVESPDGAPQLAKGMPPFAPAGGMQALDPDASGWLHLDLEPGKYIAICVIPDAGSGQAHADLGMIQEFTVE